MHRLFCSTLAAADASEPGSHSGHQPSHSLRQVVFSPCKSDPSNETHDKTLSFFWPTFESPALQLDSRRPQTRQSPAAIPATSRRIHSDRWCSHHGQATLLMKLTIKLCHFFWPFSGTGFPARLWRPPDRQSPPVSRPTAVEWTPSCPAISGSAAASRRRFRDTFAGVPATRFSVRRRSTRLSPGSTETNSRRMDSFVPGHQR